MEPFVIERGNIFAVPVTHYNMEMAAHVRLAFEKVKPDCVAVELAETMESTLIDAAARLPDISMVVTFDKNGSPLYYPAEPCDPAFEGLRSGLEAGIPVHCIDLDVDDYPDIHELLPDPYAITRIGMDNYYDAYKKIVLDREEIKPKLDEQRELYMARRLKELSLSYERILFIGGIYHVEDVLENMARDKFPELTHAKRESVNLCTIPEASCREIMAEAGWFTAAYEASRGTDKFPPDRQKLLLELYKAGAVLYKEESGLPFPGYHLRNIMKYVRNYALISGNLMPNLFQLLTAAKGCVSHNYARAVWLTATEYPHYKNVDNLEELDLTVEDVWGHSKILRFHLTQRSRKEYTYHRRRKDRKDIRFDPPAPFSICSYPPEDVVVEGFGEFLQKKGTQILTEEGAQSVPFTTSLEDGLDTRETIRHWAEKKLYVKTRGRPPGGVGSIVIIFDADKGEKEELYKEKYPWKTTWLGEHAQESDMALYATALGGEVVGPGISRCTYGGLLMSYPPRRMYDVWSDPDYLVCDDKPSVLLMAAIDYAIKPIIVYVADNPPPEKLKQFARRFGKKVVYIPIGQLSPIMLRKIQRFHVLDSHSRRDGADEYIE